MFEVDTLHSNNNDFYPLLNEQAKALVSSEPDSIANLANIASLLFLALETINWAGFYLMRDGELVLGPFQGKPACTRIPLNKGVCGAAVREKKTQRIVDVNAFEGHIACDVDSQSEIVVPVIIDGIVVAVLDIDSPVVNRFDENDQQGLESIVATLEVMIDFSRC